MAEKIPKKLWAGLALGASCVIGGLIALSKNKKVVIPDTNIVISNLSVLPHAAYPGDVITISVKATNNGPVAEATYIGVMFGDESMEERNIYLEPGEIQEVSFLLSAPDILGPMRIEVGGLVGVFQINNPNPDTSFISGHVYDANTGGPVEGALVAVLAWGGETDSSGYFSVTKIQPDWGTFPRLMEVAVLCNGYETLRQQITIPADGLTGIELEITPITETPIELVISGKNMPAYLWTGSIKDLSTGQVQTWGTINALEPVHLQPLSGNQVIIQYQALDQWMNLQGWYFFYAEIPDTSGIVTWDHANKRFMDGPVGVDLLNSNNKQLIRGTIISQDWYNNRFVLNIKESVPTSGYLDVGQYFVGDNVDVWYPVPFTPNGTILSVEVEGIMKFQKHGIAIPVEPWTVFVPGWTPQDLKMKRTYPDSAYNFTKNITAEFSTNGQYWAEADRMIYPLTKIKISVNGAVSQFKIIVGITSTQTMQISGGAYRSYPVSSIIREITGPVANWEMSGSELFQYINSFGWQTPFKVWANPDMDASFPAIPELANWVLLDTIPYFKVV
jgi:hypothetical protein